MSVADWKSPSTPVTGPAHPDLLRDRTRRAGRAGVEAPQHQPTSDGLNGCYALFGTDAVTIEPTTDDRIATGLRQMIVRTVTAVRDGVYLLY
ncbi:hypothetical protein [Nocardia sp. NPDC005745]|uniref:hypothetical protein n=1 Tax=Nocardia sp. NPDC005745 TaxID=3157061 RepID=UPI0033D24F79